MPNDSHARKSFKIQVAENVKNAATDAIATLRRCPIIASRNPRYWSGRQTVVLGALKWWPFQYFAIATYVNYSVKSTIVTDKIDVIQNRTAL